MIKWNMKLWGLLSLQKPLLQQLYLPFEPFTVPTHFLFPAKSIQTSAKFSGDPQTTASLSSIQRGSFAPTSISYSNLLSECTASKSVSSGMEVHAHIVRFGLSEDPNVRNHLINLYSKCRCFGYARKLVEESTEPDLVSWSALISGYAQNGLGKEAVLAFHEMYLLGVKCNEFTFPSVLKACSIMKDLELGKQVHGIAVVTGFESDVFVANTLVVMYAKCWEFGDSRRLFDVIPERNVVSWNALFSCYVQSDFRGEALGLFQEMVLNGIRPNEFSLSSILKACSSLGDSGQGRKIHGYLIKLGYDTDLFSANVLVNMYAKAGDMEDAIIVFDEIAQPDIVSWNAVIAGCVLCESHEWALNLFEQMKRSKICPNMFTLSSVLKACAGMGLKELGRQLHYKLIKMDLESDLFVDVKRNNAIEGLIFDKLQRIMQMRNLTKNYLSRA